MKAIPYSIIAIVVVALVLRRRRRASARSDRRHVAGRWRSSALLGDTGLVAAREVRERLRGRVYRVVTVILLAVVAAAIVIPTVRSSSHAVVRVGVVGGVTAQDRAAVLVAAKAAGVRATVSSERSVAKARGALDAGRVTLVVDDGRQVLVKTQASGGSSSSVASTVASALGLGRAMHAAGLSPAQVAAVVGARPLPVRSLHPGSGKNAANATSIIGIILIFIMLTQYLTWTLMGVVEEKTSRVVEVLLASVRPVQLLGGKVLGIGTAALLQAAVVVAFALVVAAAVGSDLLGGTAPSVLAASFCWLVVGYAFYSWVYAAAGSLVTRQEQVQSLALPLNVPIIFGYLVALTGSAGAPSLLVKALAYVPPTAPFCMPLLVAKGAATWWQFLAAVLVSVVCTVGVARLAATVYRRAVLRTARRPSLRGLLSAR